MEPKTNKSGQAIAINGLVKRHGQREILRGVSLDIASGSTMALIGPSSGLNTPNVIAAVGSLTVFSELAQS